MTIKCMASLANLYLQSAQVIIREPSNTWLVSSNLYHTSGQCLEFVFFSYVDNSFLPTCVAFVKRSSFVLVLTIAHHKSSYSSPLSSDMPSYSYALLHTYGYIMHMNTSMPCAYNIYIWKSRFRPRYFYIFMVVFFVSLMQLCIFGMFFQYDNFHVGNQMPEWTLAITRLCYIFTNVITKCINESGLDYAPFTHLETQFKARNNMQLVRGIYSPFTFFFQVQRCQGQTIC